MCSQENISLPVPLCVPPIGLEKGNYTSLFIWCNKRNVEGSDIYGGGCSVGSKGELSFGVEGLKKKVSLETPTMIMEEKFTEPLSVRVSVDMQRYIELFARKVGCSKSEMCRRLLVYALAYGQKCIVPDIVADAFMMKYNRETYMHHIKILQEAGIEITPEIIKEIKESINIEVKEE